MNKMRGWLASCGVVAVATLGAALMAADAGPKQVSATDIQEGKVQIMGRLGTPLGTFVTVAGTYHQNATKENPFPLEVDKVDGKKLDAPVILNAHGIEGKNGRYIFRGYETGGMNTIPVDPAEKVVGPGPQQPYGFVTWFEVTREMSNK